jgi:hypothetical protein
MLGPLPARSTAVPGFHITTQDDLPGPDGDEPYGLFVNETEYGNRRFLRTNVLSARPDLKKYTALRFRQEVMRHADAIAPGEDVVVVFMEALELEPPLRPSLDVITLLPVPLLLTATNSPSSGDQQSATQLLSAAERTVDQRIPLLPSTGGLPSCSASAATGPAGRVIASRSLGWSVIRAKRAGC